MKVSILSKKPKWTTKLASFAVITQALSYNSAKISLSFSLKKLQTTNYYVTFWGVLWLQNNQKKWRNTLLWRTALTQVQVLTVIKSLTMALWAQTHNHQSLITSIQWARNQELHQTTLIWTNTHSKLVFKTLRHFKWGRTLIRNYNRSSKGRNNISNNNNKMTWKRHLSIKALRARITLL